MTTQSGDTHSSEQTLSNKTYLRRLHIKLKDARRMFFAALESSRLAASPSPSSSPFIEQETGAARYMPDKTFLRTEVSLLDARGRMWPVQYECILRGGQRHSRLKHGWTKLCHANNFSVGDRIKFQTFTLVDKTTVIRVDKVVTPSSP